MFTNQPLNRLSACLAVAFLAAASLSACAQQNRSCVIDERTGAMHCGAVPDSYGNRGREYAPPVSAAPVNGNERREERMSQSQAQDLVDRLYREVLGRSADYPSLRRYADTLVNGRELSDVRIELATSNEAREAIKRIYKEVLGRDADSAGLESQINELRRGSSLAQIRDSISRSPEARSRR